MKTLKLWIVQMRDVFPEGEHRRIRLFSTECTAKKFLYDVKDQYSYAEIDEIEVDAVEDFHID